MALYSQRDIMQLDREGNHYSRHVSAMTGEGLHDKSDIAAELAFRDWQIAHLKAQQERADLLAQKLRELGCCPECLEIPQHEIDEPYSSCACGTGEDYMTRPLQKLQAAFHLDPDLGKKLPRSSRVGSDSDHTPT